MKQHLNNFYNIDNPYPYTIISPSDLKHIITPSPHCHHQIDPINIEQIITKISRSHTKDNIPEQKVTSLSGESTYQVIFSPLRGALELMQQYYNSDDNTTNQVITHTIDSLIFGSEVDLSKITALDSKQFYALSKILRAFCYNAGDCKKLIMQFLAIKLFWSNKSGHFSERI